MVELFEQDVKEFDRNSSKGNQLKWEKNGIWYKADYTGYEGLAEYVVSQLLRLSSLEPDEYILYELEDIRYKTQIFHGVKSIDLLKDDWQIITIERLFKQKYNQSLYQSVWRIRDVRERFRFLCSSVQKMTGITDIGKYFAKLLTLDAIFKNEDRHMHNIALLMNEKGEYKICPIFDNGAALLSDTRLDYPLGGDIYQQLNEVNAKTISRDFDEQLDVAEAEYGNTIKFYFTHKDVDEILTKVTNYSKDEIERVRTILYQQMRKYSYLFEKK